MTQPPQRPRIQVGTQAGERQATLPLREAHPQQPPSRPGSPPNPKESTWQIRHVFSILLAVFITVLIVWLNRAPNNAYFNVPTDSSGWAPGSEQNLVPPTSHDDGETEQNASSNIAEIARARFLAEVQPGSVSADVSLFIEPGSPQVAVASMTESLDHSLQFLSRYLDSSRNAVVIGLVTREWAVDVLEKELNNSIGFASEIDEYLKESGYGVSRSTCAGAKGVAKTDFVQSVVIVDIGASCNWSSGGWIDDSETVLPHELMHVAQFDLGGACAQIPVWFGEGQAQFVGWNLAIADADSLYAESRAHRVSVFSSTKYSSLRDFENYSDEGTEYLVGALAIELLVAEHGWESTIELVSSLNRKTAGCASGRSGFEKFETEFEARYGESLDSFSQRVWDYAGLSSSLNKP